MATKSSKSKAAPVVANKAKPAIKKPVAKPPVKRATATGDVLKELKSLAKELSKAAKGLESGKGKKGQPKEISTVLVNVERMTADAATKSLYEAESAQLAVSAVLESLGKNWSRDSIEKSLKQVNDHLTNIVVAQEFQDLAGQSIRQAIKALVGAIIMVEGGGPTEERRLSQAEIDGLMQNLMS
jgi:chemotaxis regulatin CheY-phosphate phosphatase CheZ